MTDKETDLKVQHNFILCYFVYICSTARVASNSALGTLFSFEDRFFIQLWFVCFAFLFRNYNVHLFKCRGWSDEE